MAESKRLGGNFVKKGASNPEPRKAEAITNKLMTTLRERTGGLLCRYSCGGIFERNECLCLMFSLVVASTMTSVYFLAVLAAKI